EPDQLTRLDPERDAVERGDVAVALAQAVDLEHGGRRYPGPLVLLVSTRAWSRSGCSGRRRASTRVTSATGIIARYTSGRAPAYKSPPGERALPRPACSTAAPAA